MDKENEARLLIYETVATCIAGMFDTFTTSEADTILKMVHNEIHREDNF